jgi:uncharacterized protein (DUF1330 family)
MPNGYWIARIEVTDGDRYSEYAEALPAVITRFGGHFLVAGGRCETSEGQSKPRNVIISFEDGPQLLAFEGIRHGGASSRGRGHR